jgi:methylenetetrahydrofolate dehydrogenase (NADP+) / methenyltetrahydrofolate cyclohydrolase
MHLFNGVNVAEVLSVELKKKVSKLPRSPKLVSIVVGDMGGSVFYQNLKKRKAEELGIDIEIKHFDESVRLDDIIGLIKKLNNDRSVNGIMLQIPLPDNFTLTERNYIINAIDTNKDVDGMRSDSNYESPVVRAVMHAIKEAERNEEVLNIVRLASKVRPLTLNIVILGHTGFEGEKIYKKLENMKMLFNCDFDLEGANSKTLKLENIVQNADVIISATGVVGLIKPDIVKKGVVLIDVGAPKGDIDKEAYEKASFVSPVPGGIGPLTIYYLLENIYKSAIKLV